MSADPTAGESRMVVDGRLVDEIPREKNESSRTYVGSTGEHGHLPLPEARRWSLDRVELMEDEVTAAIAEVKQAAAELTAAKQKHDRVLANLHRTRAQLAADRQVLAWRLGFGPLRPQEAPDPPAQS